MSRPGMTILELLLALALLSGLTIACVSWTTAATRALTDQGGDAAWTQGAQATLAFIDDAIATEDRSGGRARETWRVAVEGQRLTLRSRQVVATDSGTPALAETVELSAESGSLVATYRDAGGRRLAQRPLLGGALGGELVGAPSLGITVTELEGARAQVLVTLRGGRTGHAERAWTLERGELR
jgi:Tfp pilus assembly protein PilE